MSAISCSCTLRVALDGLERARGASAVEPAEAQQARPPEHRVERRPQLVRKRGEEILLGAIRRIEIFGAPAQRVFEPLALGDVADDERIAAQLTGGRPHRRQQPLRRERVAALPDAVALRLRAALFARDSDDWQGHPSRSRRWDRRTRSGGP